MARAYSYDLREKVIQALELDGWKKSEAAEIFQISRNTIDLWLKRREETGDYRPRSNRPQRTQAKITDWRAFEEFVSQHGDRTQAQMAQLWGEEISPRTISRGLKKIGFTRKKRIMAMKKGMKKPETNSKLS
jgi:transposase